MMNHTAIRRWTMSGPQWELETIDRIAGEQPGYVSRSQMQLRLNLRHAEFQAAFAQANKNTIQQPESAP
jgi:hypothetical protein